MYNFRKFAPNANTKQLSCLLVVIGAILGDIAGSRFEFNPTNNYGFALFTDECGFTDDTICTIAIADAIIHNKEYGETLHNWCRKYPNPMGGYGNMFRNWVMSRNPQPYGSLGNGSAMRVSPVGFWFCDIQEMMRQTKLSAACTHNHPEGIRGAQTVALAIHKAIELRRSGEVTPALIRSRVLDICEQFSGYNLDIQKDDVMNHFNETCHGTVPVALWIIGRSHGYEDAVRQAVSLGADADTLGAIVGGIAEALWGVPFDMACCALSFLPDEMKKVVKEFYTQNKIWDYK